MSAPRKYGDDIRQAIHQLVNTEGRPATEAYRMLALRFAEVPNIDRLRDIAREERKAHRPVLAHQPKEQQLAHLLAGIVNAVDRALEQLQKHDQPDADELLKLARTIREVEPMLKANPSRPGGQSSPAAPTLTAIAQRQDTGAGDQEAA